MDIIADLHTHTLASQHAFSTVWENVQAAKAKGFCALGITDHAPGMPDGAIEHHFYCLPNLPLVAEGVRLFRGAEVNIMDFDGRIDLSKRTLDRLELVIASYHSECIKAGSAEENTAGLIHALEDPYVDCIGHCGNPAYPIHIPQLVRACKELGKLLEINSNSFEVRPGSEVNCRLVAEACAREGVRVIVSSDAHTAWKVGDHSHALAMLEEVGFPEELVVNSSQERLWDYFSHRAHKPLSA